MANVYIVMNVMFYSRCACFLLLMGGIFKPMVLFAGEAGVRGASFLKIGSGSRAIGMGEANTAVVDDAYASNWNPAALIRLSRAEIAFTHQNSFQDVSQQNLNVAWPLSPRTGIGVYTIRQSVEGFSSFDAAGNSEGSVDASDAAYAGAFGTRINRTLSLGGGLKWVRSNLGPSSASTYAFDLGLLMRFPLAAYRGTGRVFSFGAAIQNLGPGLEYDQEKTGLPQTTRLGFGYEAPFHQNRWTLAADYNFSPDSQTYWTLGQEFWLGHLLALRAGYRSGQDEGSGIRAGIGIGVRSFQFSYSLSPFGFLGESHRFGVSFQFGPTMAAPASVSKPLPTAAIKEPVLTPPPLVKPAPFSLDISVSTPAIWGLPPATAPLEKPEVIPSTTTKKNHEKSEPLYKTKKRILSGSAKDLTDKGADYLKQGRYNEAAVAFGQALRIEPNNKTALELMRKALNELDRQKKREKGVYE